MYKIRIQLSYDGTDYSGWQRQKQAPKPTVQGALEGALSRIFDADIKVCGAGRTDAGVHALAQVAHARVPKDPTKYNLLPALNGLTPDSVAIHRVWRAPDDFHAIASAQEKTYLYWILNRPTPSALRHRYTLWHRQPLDLDYLNGFSEILEQKQDFKSFQSTGTELSGTVRELREVHWERHSGHIVQLRIRGTGFLKQMVRNIVGTQLKLFQSRAPHQEMARILEARDRREAGPTAAPQGLYLARVVYPPDLDNKCREI